MKKIKIRDDLYLNHKAHMEAVYAIKVLYEVSTNKKYKFQVNYNEGEFKAEAPEYIVASKDTLIKLQLDINNDRDIELEIDYSFVVGTSTSIMDGKKMRLKLKTNSKEFSTMIPVWTPKKDGRYNLHLKYLVKQGEITKKINTSMDAIIY